MRKVIGICVLLAGLGGLGWYAATQSAIRIQAAITEAAADITATASQEIDVRVSGRDITVTGLVTDGAELDRLNAAYSVLEGVRTVDLTGVETLAIADPYLLTATFGADGTRALSGVVPSNSARTALMAALPDAQTDLRLAAGAPDAAFADVAGAVIAAMQPMISGEMTLSGAALSISAFAPTPAEADSLQAVLEGLPSPYVADATIEVRDDGTPFRLFADLSAGQITAAGKVPNGTDAGLISARFQNVGSVQIDEAAIPADPPDWADVAGQ